MAEATSSDSKADVASIPETSVTFAHFKRKLNLQESRMTTATWGVDQPDHPPHKKQIKRILSFCIALWTFQSNDFVPHGDRTQVLWRKQTREQKRRHSLGLPFVLQSVYRPSAAQRVTQHCSRQRPTESWTQSKKKAWKFRNNLGDGDPEEFAWTHPLSQISSSAKSTTSRFSNRALFSTFLRKICWTESYTQFKTDINNSCNIMRKEKETDKDLFNFCRWDERRALLPRFPEHCQWRRRTGRRLICKRRWTRPTWLSQRRPGAFCRRDSSRTPSAPWPTGRPSCRSSCPGAGCRRCPWWLCPWQCRATAPKTKNDQHKRWVGGVGAID